jgi:phosphohistidine phosphatase
MRRLILLRHGKAVPQGSAPDFERSLETRGVEESRALGRYLAEEGIIPDLALVSPAFRTRETWQAAALAFPQIAVTFEPELYLASTDQVLHAIQTHGGDAKTLIVVGHNPSLHDLAVELVDHGDRYAFARMREYFPTASLAVFDTPDDDWQALRRHAMRLDRFRVPDPDHDTLADL